MSKSTKQLGVAETAAIDAIALADALAEALGSFACMVTLTPVGTIMRGGWVDVRINPATAIGDHTKFDFIRVRRDDNTYELAHLTHNSVTKGEARLNGTMSSAVAAIVREWLEVEF